jgi:predicted ATPase
MKAEKSLTMQSNIFLNELCGQINDSSEIRAALRTKMGRADVKVLSRVLPKAAQLCHDPSLPNLDESLSSRDREGSSLLLAESSSSNLSSRTGISSLQGSPGPGGPTTALTNIQVHLVLRKFLQTICSAAASLARPVVFVQDDLQWADEMSLTLIKALVFGASPPHAHQPSLIFIGTYRDDEEARANIAFSEFLRSCEQDCSSANSVLLLDVSLENFGVDVVNTYLSLLLVLDPQETTSLAMIVCEKTGGNMFYLVQFLDVLHSKAYLYYCHTAMKWNWDIIKIQREPDFCNNSIVVNKLQLLREPVLSALKIASCLGAVFDSSVLAVCLAALKNRSSVARVKIHEIETLATKSVQQTEVDVPMILNELAVLGLVKAVEEEVLHNLDNSLLGTFTFAHDRLQQAAYSLVPEGYERKRLHLIIGSSILYMDVAPSEYMQHILVVVDHLTRASDLLVDKKEKMRLSELNLEAANLVISQSAFFPALEYLNAALRQMDGLDKWGTELYSFSLETYNKLARVAYATGDFVLCKQIVDEVRFNVKCATDQCDVDITWLEALLATGKIDEAFKVGINGLKRLGIRFSTRPHLIYAIMCAIKAKRFLGGKSAEELVPTKRMMDKNMVAAMCILGNLIEAAFLSMRIEHFILMNIRSVNITLKHGGSIGSDTGHCAMGFVFANMGDFNLAFRMGELSLEVAEMYHPSGRYDSRVCFLAYFFLFHWKRPIHEGLDPMLRAYEAGMELGDIKNASWCATSYLTIYWCCGLPLGPLLSDIAKYRQQMVDYNQKMIYLILTPFHQAIIKLVIPSENPSNLDGEYMQVESFLKDLNCEADGAIALITVYKMRLLLAYHFDDLDVAHEMSEMMQGKLIEAEGTSVNLPFVIFFKGLTALAFVRLSGKWKYRREAQSALKRMEKWVKNGAVNSYHLLLILKAESKAVKQGSRGEDVRTAFNLAIRVSGRSGFLQDKALASERAGVYHVLKNDEYHARMYLEQATVLYSEWGALAKADYLKRKFAPYLSTETLIAETLGGSTPLYIKGQARFSADATLKHRTISITAPKS